MNKYLRTDSGHIHLDYETISAVEAKIKLTEVDPDTLTDLERGNAFRVPGNDKYYNLEIFSLSGELIATGKNTSSNIWSAIRCGALNDGDHVAVEIEACAHVLPERPEGEGWTSVFAEALCVMYHRIKFDEDKHIMVHKADSLIKIGDDDKEYHRVFEPKKPSRLKRWFSHIPPKY